MMSNDWTNKLRDRLTDYEEPVMDDLWAGIEQSLAQQETVGNHISIQQPSVNNNVSARQVWMRRFSVAAAIAALAVGGTYVYLHPWDEVKTSKEVAALEKQVEENRIKEKNFGGKGILDKNIERSQTTENVFEGKRTDQEKVENTSFSQVKTTEKSTGLIAQVRKAFDGETDKGMVSYSNIPENDRYSNVSNNTNSKVLDKSKRVGGNSTDYSETAETNSSRSIYSLEIQSTKEQDSKENQTGIERQNPTDRQTTKERRMAKVSSAEPLMVASVHDTYDSPAIIKKNSVSTWSVQFYGENGIVPGKGNTNNVPLVASAAPVPPSFFGNSDSYYDFAGIEYAGFYDSKLLKSFDDEQYYQEVKHHKPISVGMQVGVKVSPRLSLNTGLVYTYVSSDFTGTANDSRTVTKQTLHYVGIPLNLDYEVWGTKNFHTYVTAGGEGAVNVKNHTETDGVETASKKDRMQWSVNGSVGVQYDFIPQLGIYAEPGVKYYFDNGSKIENTFKDKKTNFNFQLGLRWNIGK